MIYVSNIAWIPSLYLRTQENSQPLKTPDVSTVTTWYLDQIRIQILNHLFNLCTCWAKYLMSLNSITVTIIIIIILRAIVKIKEDHDRCIVLSMASVQGLIMLLLLSEVGKCLVIAPQHLEKHQLYLFMKLLSLSLFFFTDKSAEDYNSSNTLVSLCFLHSEISGYGSKVQDSVVEIAWLQRHSFWSLPCFRFSIYRKRTGVVSCYPYLTVCFFQLYNAVEIPTLRPEMQLLVCFLCRFEHQRSSLSFCG